MKISDIQTIIVDAEGGRTWLFVEVATDAGLQGVGEASQSRLDAGVVAQVDQLSRIYIGRDPLDLIERRNLLLRRPDAGRILHAAVSGLEQALWDLCGKALGVPCYQLLGGSVREEIPVYANLALAAWGRSPEEHGVLASKAVDQGFRAVKLNAFDPSAGRPLSSHLEFRRQADTALARLREVRAAVGPDVEVLTDWSLVVPPAEAPHIADRMAELDPYWIEEPFLTGDPRQLAGFRNRVAPRLAVGEQLCGRGGFRPLLEAGAADVLMPDVKWVGGLLEARKVAAMAEVWEVEVAPHNMSGPVATAASVQLCATVPNLALLEYCWGVVPWRDELVKGTERVVNGAIPLPTEPGLGIEWDGAAARARRRD